MPVPRSVDWSTISEDDFNSTVEMLLVKEWRSKKGHRAEAIDGRGGDEGIDVGVWRDEILIHVFQLKYFREGFSGYNKQIRRQQVSDSFNRAVDAHPGLTDWTLVIPSKGSLPERKYVTSLATDLTVRTHTLGTTKLDLLLATHPEINAHVTREPLLDALSELHSEAAALASTGDLAERARALAARADSLSPYWGVNVRMSNDSVELAYFAKRPDAAEKEPLSINLVTTFGPGFEELRKEYESAMAFGLIRPVVLPSEVVTEFTFKGPEWAQHKSGPGSLEFHPQPLKKAVTVEVRAFSKDGRIISALEGKTVAFGQGSRGFKISTVFRDALTLDWTVDPDSQESTLNLSYEIAGRSASDILPALRFAASLEHAHALELLAEGLPILKVQEGDLGAPAEIVDAVLFELIEDLAYLEGELPAVLRVPTQTKAIDHLNVRFARMMLEGKIAFVPGAGGLNFTLSGENVDGFEGLLTAPGQQIRLDQLDFQIDILGQAVTLGMMRFWHPSMIVEHADVLRAAIAVGDVTGLNVELVPTDGSGLRAFMPARVVPDAKVIPEPWGIKQIPEHRTLNKVRKEAAKAISVEAANSPRTILP